jgi:hypothetical protein
MPGSSSPSFIPKRNVNKKDKQGAKRQVFFGTLILRILFIAVLISAGGVYLYEDKLNKNLQSEIVVFNEAIKKFDVNDMEKVLEFDLRLSQANNRLDNSVSVSALMDAFEKSTAGSSQLKSFSFNREDDSNIEIEVEIETTDFDSVLFQRSVFNSGGALSVIEIEDLSLNNVPPDSSLFQAEQANEREELSVVFKVLLAVDPSMARHLPSTAMTLGNFVPVENIPVLELVQPEATSSTLNESEISENII